MRDLWLCIAGTLVLWTVSGALSILLGLALAAGTFSFHRPLRIASYVGINVTRGVPTSIFVIAAGIGMMRASRIPELPVLFPGTPAAFQLVAWGIVLALAFGSAGHFAEIFRSGRSALGRYRLEQARVLGLSPLRHAALLVRESAAIALPPTGGRLIHHLHNTAFAALFPVMDLFGFIQGQSNATFRVLDFALLGCAIYVTLSGLIWMVIRILEAALAPPAAVPRKRRAIAW